MLCTGSFNCEKKFERVNKPDSLPALKRKGTVQGLLFYRRAPRRSRKKRRNKKERTVVLFVEISNRPAGPIQRD